MFTDRNTKRQKVKQTERLIDINTAIKEGWKKRYATFIPFKALLFKKDPKMLSVLQPTDKVNNKNSYSVLKGSLQRKDNKNY